MICSSLQFFDQLTMRESRLAQLDFLIVLIDDRQPRSALFFIKAFD